MNGFGNNSMLPILLLTMGGGGNCGIDPMMLMLIMCMCGNGGGIGACETN